MGEMPEPAMSVRWAWTALLGLVLLHPAPALAYEFDAPGTVPVHEAMTRLALRCADERAPDDAGPLAPGLDCRAYFAALAAEVSAPNPNVWSLFEKLSAWPDDPTRMRFGLSVFKMLLTERRCPARVQKNAALHRVGLFCAVHYGELQFAHAMRSHESETLAQTAAQILDWATWNFRVATGDVDVGADHCASVRSVGGSIAPFLAPTGSDALPWCAEGADVTPGRDGTWAVYTPYTLECQHPFSSKTCTVMPDAPKLAVQVALGTILHVVQDSYSQSHVRRSEQPVVASEFSPVASCGAIRGFYRYNVQDSLLHSQADSVPQLACDDGQPNLDAITASAYVILATRAGSGVSPAAFRAFLAEHVFRLAD